MNVNSLTKVVIACLILAMGCDRKSEKPQPALEVAFEWGEAAHGLAASLTASQAVFPSGQAVEVRYRIKNVSGREVTVWNSGFWPNHRLVVVDERDVEIALTEAGKEALAAFDPNGPRRKNIAVPLAPGAIDVQYASLDLRRYFQLTPGKYRARCLYHEGPVMVWSNSLAIEIQ